MSQKIPLSPIESPSQQNPRITVLQPSLKKRHLCSISLRSLRLSFVLPTLQYPNMRILKVTYMEWSQTLPLYHVIYVHLNSTFKWSRSLLTKLIISNYKMKMKFSCKSLNARSETMGRVNENIIEIYDHMIQIEPL